MLRLDEGSAGMTGISIPSVLKIRCFSVRIRVPAPHIRSGRLGKLANPLRLGRRYSEFESRVGYQTLVSVAEQVYALASKARFCGFESHLRHHIS